MMDWSRVILFQQFINPLQPGLAFLHPLKTSENLKVFWCFQGVWKSNAGRSWIKWGSFTPCEILKALSHVMHLFFYLVFCCVTTTQEISNQTVVAEARTFTKTNTPPWMCFSRFLNCTDSTKSSKASHIIRNFFDFWFPFSYILLIWFSNVSFESIIIPRSSSISSRLNAVIDNITIAVLFQDINLLCANPTKWPNTIRRQITEELFECVWPFCGVGA